MKKFRLNKKFWVALFVSGLIGLVFYLYFFVYVAGNEKELVESRFRSLRRIAKNIVEARGNSIQKFRFSLNLLSKKIFEADDPLEEFRTFNVKEEQAGRNVYLSSDSSYQKRRLNFSDSVYISMTLSESDTELKDLQSFLEYFTSFDYSANSSSNPNIFSQSIANNAFLKSQEINLTNSFEEFAIIKIKKRIGHLESSNKKTEKKTTESNLGTACIGYQTFTNELRLAELDSLFTIGAGFHSAKEFDVTIQGSEYKLFAHLLAFDRDEDWLLCGFTEKSNFTSQSRHVELFVGLLLAFLIIAILLSMPIIKLLVMSSVERLQIINVWFTGFSIIIGASVITLLILFSSDNLGGHREQDKNLRTIGNKICTSFESELALTVSQLNWFEKNTNLLFPESTFNKLTEESDTETKDTTTLKWALSVSTDSLKKKIKEMPYSTYTAALWIDEKGDELYSIRNDPDDIRSTYKNKFTSLKNRKYFKDAHDDTSNLWYLKSKNEPKNNRFAMQSLRSWSSGKNEVGVSIPVNHKNYRVQALITRFGSVMETLLPPGYGFCIVDSNLDNNNDDDDDNNAGTVWFHSDTKLNHQENLFEETRNAELLKSAILGRDSVALFFKYKEKTKRGYVMPLKGIPLSLVIFYDMDYYRKPWNFSVGQASIYTTFMFGVIGVHLLLLFVCTYRPTRLRIKRFFLSWLRPKMDGDLLTVEGINLMTPSVKYRRSILFLFIVLLFMTMLFFFTHHRWLSLCFILLPIYILVFHFTLFRREFILFEKEKKNRTKWWCLLAHPFVLCSIVLVIVLNLFGLQYLDSCKVAWVILTQIFWIGVALTTYKVFPETWVIKITSIKLLGSSRLDFPQTYRVSLGLWLVLVSLMAPAYFYKNAFHTENTIWKRYLLLESARNSVSRETKISEIRNAKLSNPKDAKTETLGNYLGSTKEFVLTQNPKIILPKPNSNYDELLFLSDPLFGGVMGDVRQAIFPTPSDTLWYWNSSDSIRLNYKTYGGKKIQLATSIPHHSFFKGDYWPFMLIVCLIALFVIFRVLRFAVKHIFGLEWLDQDSVEALETEWKLAERAIIIGLPYSGKTKLIPDNIPKECRINLRNPPYRITESETIVFEHFEHGINSHSMNEQKLQLLNYAVSHTRNHIIILSCVQPSVIFDFYDSMMAELNPEKDKTEYREYKQAVRYWKNLLSGFTIYYQTLTIPETSQKLTHAQWFINSEINHGNYLPQLKASIDQSGEFNYRQKEELVLQVEERAENYYQSLWNSFSNAEKFLLHDLANDRFVNFRNLKVIRGLLQTGMLTMNDSLRIMNRSFNNFILSVVKEGEELKMEKELRSGGTWHTVQIGLILTLLGLITFIGLSQQGMLSSLSAWATAITGIVTLLTRFGGIFGDKSKE